MATRHQLPSPPTADPDAAVAWVRLHLGDLVPDEVTASPRYRGGATAADTALSALDVTGYSADRNEVWPPERRGASGLSPWIRHGLLPLPRMWAAVEPAPPRDRARFRDELLWQEYARHLYARLGAATGRGLRHERPVATVGRDVPVWDRSMNCLDLAVKELVTDGWVVNQARMWLASNWAVRAGADWRDGEDVFFRHLLDGSRAANRTGWQWTAGTATGRTYHATRWQVERRAPGLCDGCVHRDACPIEDRTEDVPLERATEHPRLRHDPEPGATAGPQEPEAGTPDAVWLTAESLGDSDPALTANPDLPVVFVFDAPLLARLRLSGKRLVFLAETLGELATRRDLEVHRGDPVTLLRGRRLAATAAPVPGFRARAARLEVSRYPWPWLARPHTGSVASFSAWRRAIDVGG